MSRSIRPFSFCKFKTFNATGGLSNSSLVFESGREIDKVDTFKLEPQFDSQNNIEVVCVTNMLSVGNLMIEKLFILQSCQPTSFFYLPNSFLN